MAEYMPGMPMDIGSPDRLWKGGVKTNGILMRAVNGRIPSLVEGYARIVIDGASVLYIPDVVPWGNALWRDVGEIDTRPGVRYARPLRESRRLSAFLSLTRGGRRVSLFSLTGCRRIRPAPLSVRASWGMNTRWPGQARRTPT